MRFTFGKPEKLKSRKLIGKLFEDGKSVKKFPVRLVYLQTNHTSDFPVQAGFSVPKRNFKRAVDRNRIKRLIRESFRIRLTDQGVDVVVLTRNPIINMDNTQIFEQLDWLLQRIEKRNW